ncbi:hypothetical protein LWI28_008861 [Acer negundo]|uniref:Uncharacterized protein n=1 Tax=Acer negundo TaxID=4023 RepID=A0AAD5JPP4_ACENE|nr:hypothetical protein LWI28_008861 [Acer negundo]
MVGHYGRNKTLKQYFRWVAKVYLESQFLQRMEQLKNINPEAAQYVTDAGIERWARAYSPRKRYNIMSTNIAEAISNAIKECKELPIAGVINYIKGVLQSWFYDRRTSALKLTTQLTKAADVAIGVKDEKARYMRIYPITFYTFIEPTRSVMYVRTTAEKEADNDVGVLLTETMASNLANKEVFDH